MNFFKKIAMFLCIALGLFFNTSNAMINTINEEKKINAEKLIESNKHIDVCKHLNDLLEDQDYEALMSALYYQIDKISNPYVIEWVDKQAELGIVHCLYLKNRLEHKRGQKSIITKESIESALQTIISTYIFTRQAIACCEKVSEEYLQKAWQSHQVLQQKYKHLWYDRLNDLAQAKKLPKYKKIIEIVASKFHADSSFIKTSVQKPAYIHEIVFTSSMPGCWGITFGSPSLLLKDNFKNAVKTFNSLVGDAANQAIKELYSLKNWEEYFAVCDKIVDKNNDKKIEINIKENQSENNEELSLKKLKIKLSDLEDPDNEYDSDGEKF